MDDRRNILPYASPMEKRPRSDVASTIRTIFTVIGIVFGFWLVLFALVSLFHVLLFQWAD